MCFYLKGRLPKSWRTYNNHYPLSSQSENTSDSEKIHAFEQQSLSQGPFQSQAILNINSDSNAYSTSPIESIEAFRNVTRWLDSSNEDAAFWWQMTGPLLGLLLSEASYDVHSQYQALLFYNRFVVTVLGRRPASNRMHRIWKSYMTDDHSPIEFSWNWSDSTKPPRIRCTIEAIPSEIDSIDPSNQEECVKLVRQLRGTLPNNDWQLFDYFANAFRLRANSRAEAVAQADSRGYRSSMFLGFEFEKDRIVIKAYFAPVVETGDSVWKAIVRSVKALEHGQIEFLALLELDSFLAVSHEGIQLNVEGLAIDCVPLSKSRLKIYARSSLTSFDSVRTYMTMGGKITHSEKVWRQLRDMWCLVLGLDEDFPSAQDLPFKDHQTAGMMYNYDIKAGNIMAEPKIYINTRHYGRNDLDVAHGLATFMEKHGRAGFTSNYWRAVHGFCSYRNLDRECGLQTYISCAVQNDSLSLTSYLSPQVYHRLGFDG